MKKTFIAPQLEIVNFGAQDFIMLSADEKGNSMELDLADLFVG